MKHDEDTQKMIHIILCKLEQLSPEHVHKVLVVTSTLLDIQEQRSA